MPTFEEEQFEIFQRSLNKQRKEQGFEEENLSEASKFSENLKKQQIETQNKVHKAVLSTTPTQKVELMNSQAPAETQQLLDQASAPDNVKNAAKKIYADPNRLAQKHAEIKAKKVEGKPLGLVDSFLEAATHFMPQVLGMAVGGVLEGSEGAVEGGEAGRVAGEGFRRAQQARQAAVLAQQTQEDRTRIAEEGLELREQAQARETITGERAQRRLDIQERRLALAGIKEQRLERKFDVQKEQFAEKQVLDAGKFGLAKEKAAALSDAQVTDLSNIDVALSQVNQFDFKALDKTGPIEGRVRAFAESVGVEGDLDFVELKAQVNATLADYMKTISGSAVSEQEAERLKAILPQAKDSAPQFKAKLARFESQLRARMKTKVKGITKGQSLRSKAAKRFLEGSETVKDIKKKAVKKQTKRSRLEELRAKRGAK